jgi:hypothetical protein
MTVVGIKLLAVVLGCVVLCTLPVPLAEVEADDPYVVTVVVVMGNENGNFDREDELAAVLVGCGVTTTVVLLVSTEVRDSVATTLVVWLIARMHGIIPVCFPVFVTKEVATCGVPFMVVG